MKRDITLEAIASEMLFDAAFSSESCKVLSWHPPDSKAYFTRLLYLPWEGKRVHIDLILQAQETLYLVEVKGNLHDSEIDVIKLSELIKTFTVAEMVKRFEDQGQRFTKRPTAVRPVIAAYVEDETFLGLHADLPIVIADGKVC